jgi:hypothetical protein
MKDALRRPLVRAAVLALAWVILFAVLIRSLDVAFAWWKGELGQPGWGDWFWIVLLPVWVFVYARYFSIFRPGCRACATGDDEPLGPRGV